MSFYFAKKRRRANAELRRHFMQQTDSSITESGLLSSHEENKTVVHGII